MTATVAEEVGARAMRLLDKAVRLGARDECTVRVRVARAQVGAHGLDHRVRHLRPAWGIGEDARLAVQRSSQRGEPCPEGRGIELRHRRIP